MLSGLCKPIHSSAQQANNSKDDVNRCIPVSGKFMSSHPSALATLALAIQREDY